MVPTALNIIQERISDAAGLNRANEDGVRRVLVAGYINIGAVPVSFCPASSGRLPLLLLFWFMTHWLLLVLLMFTRRVLPASRAIRMSSSSVKARINSRSHYLLTHSLFTHSLMQVTSYNVLSSSLCEPSYYPWCSVSNLDQSNRLEKVKNKLNKEIQSRAIICLQVTH